MISVVIPVYNEEEIISLLHTSVRAAMQETGENWEVIYVNDGSRDSSLRLLRELQSDDHRIVIVDLSRNWGHMGALHAGMQTARGDAVVLMDGDLQDPPEVVPKLVATWKRGAQVVTAVRRSRQESRKILAFLFPLFYRVLGTLSDYPIPLNAGIFGLLDRQAINAVNRLREGNRYLPGLRAWVGYRTAVVYYDRQDRAGGEGKLTFLSRIKYAMDAITSFSYKPLRFSFVLAAFGMLACAILSVLALVSEAGATKFGLLAAMMLMASLPLFCMGLLGEYVGRIYDEVRQRPLSLIQQVYRSEHAFSSAHLTAEAIAARLKPSAEEFPAA